MEENIPEELGGFEHCLDVQECQESVYVVRCCGQANRPSAILSRSSRTSGKSLVLKCNISKLIHPGTILINNSVEYNRTLRSGNASLPNKLKNMSSSCSVSLQT